MTIKFTYDYVKNFINNTNYYLLLSDEYFGRDEYLVVCDIYDYKYKTTFSNFCIQMKRKCKLYEVSPYNPFSINNIQNYIENNNLKIKYHSGKYINDTSKNLSFQCLNCGNFFDSSWGYIKSGKGLCKCVTLWRINCDHNNLVINEPIISSEWDYENNEDTPEEYTVGAHDYKNWICGICGFKWSAKISSRCSGRCCPKCDESNGEKKIANFLNENNIEFIQEFIIPECKYKRTLPFDFYLSDCGVLIEYDSVLHYKDKFNNPEEFALVQLRDNIKTQFCINNNIPLLRIPYWDFNNIEQILEQELSQYVN